MKINYKLPKWEKIFQLGLNYASSMWASYLLQEFCDETAVNQMFFGNVNGVMIYRLEDTAPKRWHVTGRFARIQIIGIELQKTKFIFEVLEPPEDQIFGYILRRPYIKNDTEHEIRMHIVQDILTELNGKPLSVREQIMMSAEREKEHPEFDLEMEIQKKLDQSAQFIIAKRESRLKILTDAFIEYMDNKLPSDPLQEFIEVAPKEITDGKDLAIDPDFGQDEQTQFKELSEEEKLSIVENSEYMKKYCRSYKVKAAKLILEAIVDAHKEWTDGRFGPGFIAHYIPNDIGLTKNAIGRYIQGFCKAGIATWKETPLPCMPKNRPKK